jgi:hypothetical protein
VLQSGKSDARSIPVADLRGMKRLVAVFRRNLYWGRTQGWGNLVEEHDLNLKVRIPRDTRKFLHGLRHPVQPGTARPVFVVGAQRSGTNMVTHGLDMSPEFRVYNEGNSRAFSNYRLRPDRVIAALVEKSRHPFVLFKPLLESHRIASLLDGLGTATSPRAVWIYRDVRGRVSSELAKFGDSNLRVIRRRSQDPSWRHWQLNGEVGLSAASAALLDRFDVHQLSAADGAALFWLIRNRLIFELGLDNRRDVQIVSYDQLVARPEAAMERLCAFLGFPYSPALIKHVKPRSAVEGADPSIDKEILQLCDELRNQMDALTS